MTAPINDFKAFSQLVNYSLINSLKIDPDADLEGNDHQLREVFSGHYVPVKPTPIPNPEYVSHSKVFFKELGIDDQLAKDKNFIKVFSGDLSEVSTPMKKYGWATGYALSIYGTEYTAQCPFRSGNAYGDGRAISVFEGVFLGKRYEMQLKGGGPTPYCRGADGRAVLRSSVREFLAQEYMHALGIPTSRSLTLFVSHSEKVKRPWYSEDSRSPDPDVMVDNPAAISTRVAPSFLRVGQVELFARRTRNKAHQSAREELEMIVRHLIEREYQSEVNQNQALEKQLVELAKEFRERLTTLVANWIRVGYCQGNFNSDNCAAGGFTLDYGPFGFCESFHPEFQPWTGGGKHFSFFNQPQAAEANYHMFWTAIRQLFSEDSEEIVELDKIREGFGEVMKEKWEIMWASKLGLVRFDSRLFNSLIPLMVESSVDYTNFFRELSKLPENIDTLEKSFYREISSELNHKWQEWLDQWLSLVKNRKENQDEISRRMKRVNPKYAWREWLIVPAYKKAATGDYSLIQELQEVFTDPYGEQSKEVEEKYSQLKPKEYFNKGGISFYSCSS